MARPTRCRRVCHLPDNLEFRPKCKTKAPPIVLALDEFEAIRLIDREGLSQKECANQLEVGRTTVQRIYESARKKLADALVLGRPLIIEGGEFNLCNGKTDFCYKKECQKRQIQTEFNKNKGENIMRIAVTYENGNIFQHFGHTEQFKLYDVENNKIVKTEIISTNGSGHGALAGVLSALKADILICGGIGGGAKTALAQNGIKLYGGVSGNADAAVNAFLANTLDFNPNVHCNHHNHEHGSEAHTCGEHGCGHGHCADH